MSGRLPKNWRGRGSLVAGPLTIGNVRVFGPILPAVNLEPVSPGRYLAVKTLTTVEAGRTVILSIGR